MHIMSALPTPRNDVSHPAAMSEREREEWRTVLTVAAHPGASLTATELVAARNRDYAAMFSEASGSLGDTPAEHKFRMDTIDALSRRCPQCKQELVSAGDHNEWTFAFPVDKYLTLARKPISDVVLFSLLTKPFAAERNKAIERELFAAYNKSPLADDEFQFFGKTQIPAKKFWLIDVVREMAWLYTTKHVSVEACSVFGDMHGVSFEGRTVYRGHDEPMFCVRVRTDSAPYTEYGVATYPPVA